MMIESSGASARTRPGETLHPGIEPIFAQLGVLEGVQNSGFHRHRGVWVEWDGPRAFQPYGRDAAGPWLGFQADRSRLDALLLDAARAAGATVLQPCRATGVLRNAKNEIAGVETSSGPIYARWIADATGRRSWLASELGLAAEHHSPSLRVRFGWSAARGDDHDDQPTLQAHPRGWDWRAPLSGSRSAWVKLRISSVDTRPVVENAKGIDLRWRFLPACAGPGYFVLGDAAATLDPSSSHGVLRALMSGILASHLLTGVETKSLDPAIAAAIYCDWMRAEFTHDTAALRSLWQRHPSEAVRREMDRSFREPSLSA